MQLSKNAQQLLLPGVSPEMLSPTFWTVRFWDLDLDEDLMKNFKLPPENSLGNYLANIDSRLQNLYDENCAPLALEKFIPQIVDWEHPEFGLIIESTDLKLLPRLAPLFSKKGEPDFDRNQLSVIDPGEPVNLFGISSDGNWLGVVSEAGVGWVKREMVGISSRKEIEAYLYESDRLMTTDPNPKIQSNDGFSDASMGCNYPLKDHLRQTVVIPGKNSNGSITFKTGVIIGGTVRNHLPKTSHHLLRQAFKYLGWRYAWGDRDAEGIGRDCSRLVRDVLRSLGFKPPRNSQEQLAGGKKRTKLMGLNVAERLAGLKEASPGSLLFTPSHVMFFLGEYRGEVYAIHALNNYHQIADNKEEPVKVKQVVVSGLSLGLGTSTGSLLEQLTEVIEV